MTSIMAAFGSFAKPPKNEQARTQNQKFINHNFIWFVYFIAKNKYLNSQIYRNLYLRSSALLRSVRWTPLPTFRVNVSVPSSRVTQSKKKLVQCAA